MAFDKKQFASDMADSGMEEMQAELLGDKLSDNQDAMLSQVASKQDITDLRGGFGSDHASLRVELDGRIVSATNELRREFSEQTQKTRLQIDDMQGGIRQAEARLEWRLKDGFGSVNHKFNMLTLSNTAVVLAVMGFMFFLLRG